MLSRQHAIRADRLTIRETGPPTTCAHSISPSCLQSMYNIPTNPATAQGNDLFISGYGDEVANTDDMKVSPSMSKPFHCCDPSC